MSNPSQVQVIAVPEVDYGVTPDLATAVASTVRWTSESLSGTPTTVESAELRNDRMSAGQSVVGLVSGGDINFELSKDPVYDRFMALAMMNDWVAGISLPAGSITLTKQAVPDDQLADILFVGDTSNIDGAGRALAAGDIVVLSGFVNPANNGPVQVSEVLSTTSFEAIVPRDSVTETIAAGIVILGDYVDIGSLIQSETLSKAYMDVTHLATAEEHSQRYTGAIVNRFALDVAYGQIITGTFGFLANGYLQEHPSLAQQIEADGGTIEPAGTSLVMNGSVDLNLVTVDGEPTDFCIQSIGLDLNNNATPQNCIGSIAPSQYVLGTASIAITMSIYLADPSYDRFMPAKLSQSPIGIMFGAQNEDGGYAFDLRAVQLTFPDPAASGGNSPVLMDATGVARVGEGGTSAMRIWRW